MLLVSHCSPPILARLFAHYQSWGRFSTLKIAKTIFKPKPCTSLPHSLFYVCCFIFSLVMFLSLSIKAQQNSGVLSNKFNKFYSSLYYTWMSLIYINATSTRSYRWVKWFIVVMFICLFSSCLCMQPVCLSLFALCVCMHANMGILPSIFPFTHNDTHSCT